MPHLSEGWVIEKTPTNPVMGGLRTYNLEVCSELLYRIPCFYIRIYTQLKNLATTLANQSQSVNYQPRKSIFYFQRSLHNKCHSMYYNCCCPPFWFLPSTIYKLLEINSKLSAIYIPINTNINNQKSILIWRDLEDCDTFLRVSFSRHVTVVASHER